MAAMFFCTDCGYETSKWSGKCPNCGSWDTLKESEKVAGKAGRIKSDGMATAPTRITEIKSLPLERIPTGVSEFDVVLGGGVIPGMVILLGGEPGVGKSTLMLQLSDWLAKLGKKVVYFSGEESADQINLRAKRLKISHENIWLACTNEADSIIEQLANLEMDAAIIDSIQSVGLSSVDSIPGSISQLKECCSQFVRQAKRKGIPIFLVGHVTKDGMVAGPKIIEHMVDTVLYFEGEATNQYKMLRAVKNRFGSTNELGLFEMTSLGLQQLEKPEPDVPECQSQPVRQRFGLHDRRHPRFYRGSAGIGNCIQFRYSPACGSGTGPEEAGPAAGYPGKEPVAISAQQRCLYQYDRRYQSH
jgi:DNA repair protein RadA/Sms